MAELLDAVAGIIKRHLPPGRADGLTDPDRALADLGLDSLALAGVVVDVETSLAVDFPADALNAETFRTVRSLAEAVAALGGHA